MHVLSRRQAKGVMQSLLGRVGLRSPSTQRGRSRMFIIDSIDFLTTWAFRLGLVALGTGLIFWLATTFIKLAFPGKGVAIPAVQIVGGSRVATHGEMLSHLLSSELDRIRSEFTTA